MRDTLGESLRKLKWTRVRKHRMSAALLALSLVVMLNVFWSLRQPGLTLAGDAACGILEHTHDETCGVQVCICDLSEEPHTHDDSCYETHFVEAQEELRLICEESETPHIHGDDCYEIIVTEPIVETVLICEDEDEAHIHKDGCYETTETEGSEETVLTCDLTYEPHEHTENCFSAEIIEAHEEQVLVCGLSEEIHVHDDACYAWEVLCGYQKHVHSIECYSDETADVETPLDWQELFADYPYTGDLRRDLVGIAETQVGYAESERNFKVDDDGVRRGYTRYGAWYGAPYSDWSAMFVSFCLNYAGADPEEAPGNTGANSMAKTWSKLGKYASVEEYLPSSGDLVFFTDNTVGIVTEVHNATFYVICGDMDDAVDGMVLSLADDSIAGWGSTEGTVPVAEEPLEPTAPPEEQVDDPFAEEMPETLPGEPFPLEPEAVGELPDSVVSALYVPGIENVDLLDISNGPAVFIFADTSVEPQMQRLTFMSPRTTIDMVSYLKDYGGTYFFTLLDTNNRELPKDEDGNYIVKAGTSYKLTLGITNPNGFKPGTYQYSLPDGLMVNGGTGSFILKDGTDVGAWEVTDNGLITMVFNDHMNNHTDITISATMGIVFPVQDEPLDFDGKITVTIESPPVEDVSTKLTKWGKQGEEGDKQNKTDPSKLYWQVVITGQEASQIPGSIITDQLLAGGTQTGDSHYTQSDMEAGIRIGISQPDPETGEQLKWHEVMVYPGDPNLTWTEDGWTYKIPESIQCRGCPDPVVLGNDGWIYYFDYTSTPDPLKNAGTLGYMNRVIVDGQQIESWADFTHAGSNLPDVVKTGSFHGDADGGVFLWELQVTVPGKEDHGRAAYYTTIIDNLRVKSPQGNTIGYVNNDAILASITTIYNGQRITVPRVEEATAADPFAWALGWSEDHGDGIYYSRGIYLLCRCQCSEETCHSWVANGNYCGAPHWLMNEWGGAYRSEFCYCWTPEEALTFTFSYETDDPSVVGVYGGQGNDLQNEVFLQQTDPNDKAATIGSAWVNVPIPGVFKKELTHDFNGYTANYEITVNEAKLALTDGSPLTIHDVMTQTLAFVRGSLTITTEDANGNIGTLQQGTDYTVTYDGTGTVTDENGAPVHVLDIVILHPQPVMYLLNYDATLIIPPGTTQAVKYSNSATITLWGEDMTDSSEEKVYADINIAAKRYQVGLHKKDSLTGEPLGGATFGLFNEQGGLIASDVTDANGELLFEADIIQGVILREHVLYYMQELEAPAGYQLDNTEYWFCFCNSMEASCAACNVVMAGKDAFRIPLDQIGKVDVVNELMHYDLPATGGPGIYPILLASVMFILTPLVYGLIRRRKQERRGVG